MVLLGTFLQDAGIGVRMVDSWEGYGCGCIDGSFSSSFSKASYF